MRQQILPKRAATAKKQARAQVGILVGLCAVLVTVVVFVIPNSRGPANRTPRLAATSEPATAVNLEPTGERFSERELMAVELPERMRIGVVWMNGEMPGSYGDPFIPPVDGCLPVEERYSRLFFIEQFPFDDLFRFEGQRWMRLGERVVADGREFEVRRLDFAAQEVEIEDVATGERFLIGTRMRWEMRFHPGGFESRRD